MQSTFVQFDGVKKTSVHTEQIDEKNLGPWEVVLETEASIISAGTELARLTGLEDDGGFPYRPGYAAVGRIRAKGDAVNDFAVGDRVFWAGKHASVQRFEHGQDHQWGRLYPVAENIDPTKAVYVCLAQIASISVLTAKPQLGDTVAVFGLGVIGNLAAQLYQLLGAEVLGLDPLQKRAELARECGIKSVSTAAPADQVDAVKKHFDGGASITVDAVGHSAVVQNCVAATADFGQIDLLGSPRAAFQGNLTQAFSDIHVRGLVLRGAHMWRLPPNDVRGVKHTVSSSYRTLLQLIENGSLNIGPLNSHTVSIDQANQMYQGLLEKPTEYWGVVFTY